MTEGWWKYAKPGNKVVCVDDRWPSPGRSEYGACPLEVGAIYSVLAIISGKGLGCDGALLDDAPTAVIQGVPNKSVLSGLEVGWDVRRFRPLVTKSTETGMAMLKAILHGAPVKEDA